MANIKTSSWVHRILRGMPGFIDKRDDDDGLSQYSWTPSPVLGVYDNHEGVHPSMVIVTEDSLLMVEDASVARIRYREIEDVVAPSKGTSGSITLSISGNEQYAFVVSGGVGKLEDAFEFVRFLLRVSEEHGVRASTPYEIGAPRGLGAEGGGR